MSGVVVRPFTPIILGVSGVASSAGANTTENVLATVNIPGGMMGPNGQLRIYTLWNYTNSANNKVLRVRLGGAGGTQALAITHTTSTQFADFRVIQNANAQNSQIFFDRGSTPHPGATSAGTNTTAAIDTSAATTLVMTGQKASSGETITLVSYCVELIRAG
jgi:hypothetical protein